MNKPNQQTIAVFNGVDNLMDNTCIKKVYKQPVHILLHYIRMYVNTYPTVHIYYHRYTVVFAFLRIHTYLQNACMHAVV